VDKSDAQLAGMIDHTILKSSTTEADVERVCSEAQKYGFAAVVVPPSFVGTAADMTGRSGPAVCSVAGFPFGWETQAEKLRQAESLLTAGAVEVDVVMNIGAFLSGRTDLVEAETRALADLLSGNAVFKLIIETAYLDDDGIRRAALLGAGAGADFIKTSTGFAPRGATPGDVRIIASAVGKDVGVKAAGGIRTRVEADVLVAAGATRLGCSVSVDLFEE
jgi:deoxyribose-phosphate aldolase